jgi:hypothetical protein
MRRHLLSVFFSLFAACAAHAGAVLPPGSTNGAVQFNCSGSFCGNASSFWWDNTNYRLGIGTGSPAYPLDVVGTSGTLGAIESTGTNPAQFMINDQAGGQITQLCIADAGACKLNVGHDASNNLFLQDGVNSANFVALNPSTKALTIGETGGSVTITNCTNCGSGSVPIYEDSNGNLWFNNSTNDGNLSTLFKDTILSGTPGVSNGTALCWGIDVTGVAVSAWCIDSSGNVEAGVSGGSYYIVPNFTWNGDPTATGTKEVTVTSSGVGINQTSPTAQLDVGGPERVETNSYNSTAVSMATNASLTAFTLPATPASLISGKTYAVDVYVTGITAGSSGGVKFDLGGGTLTASAVQGTCDAILVTVAQGGTLTAESHYPVNITALTNSTTGLIADTATWTNGSIQCHLTITTSAAGTFNSRIAQNASNSTATTVPIGGYRQFITQLN